MLYIQTKVLLFCNEFTDVDTVPYYRLFELSGLNLKNPLKRNSS